MSSETPREFFFPVHVEDLESYEKSGEGRYVMDEVQDVSVISTEDQIATLRALFHELGRSPVLHINESGMIGPLYSFIKALPLPGCVGKEARALIAHECSEKLTRLLTHLSNYIRREATAGVPPQNMLLSRSCAKMYAFAICQVLTSSVSSDASANSNGVTMSQPIGRTRAVGRGGRRGAAGGVALAADEDASGVDISGREQAVVALTRLFDASLAPMWRDDGAVEDPVITTLLKVVVHLLSQKRNVDGEHNAVCSSIFALLTATAQSVSSRFQKAEVARQTDGTANTAPDPRDLLVAPLTELLLKFPFIAKFLAHWIAEVDAGEATNGAWAHPLLQSMLESAVHAAVEDVVGDAPAAKNITVFMEELSRSRITFICNQPSCVVNLLQAESYEVRKAGISVTSEILVQRYSGFLRDPLDERRRDDLLRELLSRILDLNPFARTHCLHQWCELVKKKAVPRAFFLAVTESAAGRLEDKNYLVRNAAMQLLAEIMRKNWFSTVLSRESNRERFAQHTAEVRQKFLQRDGKTEEDFLEAWNAARASQRPQQVEEARAMRLDDEEAPAVGDVEVDPLLETEDDAVDGARHATEVVDVKTEAAHHAARLSGSSDQQRPSVLLRQQHDADIMRLVYYENALVFITLLERAQALAIELLESKNERNVIEAIRFLVVCSEYHLEGSTAAVLRFLVMVFEGEVNIQLAVREAFYAVFFQSFASLAVSPMRRCMASALKIISVLRIATEGEVNAMDRLFRMLRQENHKALSDLFFDAVWSVVDGSVDQQAAAQHGTPSTVDPMERRIALRLYSMLAAVNPRDVALRRPVIIELLQRHGGDNMLLTYGFQALQQEALNRGFAVVDDRVDPNEHPTLALLTRHICKPTSKVGLWMPMAEAALNTIHTLCKTPIVLYTSIVEYLARAVQDMSQASKPAEIVAKCEGSTELSCRVAQLLFVVGHTALKHIVSIDCWERAQLKALEEADRAAAAAPQASSVGLRSARSSGVVPAEPLDVMHKELGMGSNAAKRHDIEDAAGKKKRVMFEEASSIWSQHAPLAVRCCMQVPHKQLSDLRTAATLSLSKLMIASSDFCAQNLPLLFTIASNERESWVVKVNVLLAIGDLACVHPNLVEPFMRIKDKGLFSLLNDADARVRAVTVQICSHLVLSEMLRIGDRLHCVVRLVADVDPAIRANAVAFVKNYTLKNRRTIGNHIPPLIPTLSEALPTEAFQATLRTLLEKVEKDKPTESLIEKLCERFGSFTDRSRKRRVLARNLAFCLSELDFSTERAVKKITSEHCYEHYRQWLRDEEVFASFQSIIAKTRKQSGGPAGTRAQGERRDHAAIDEWEARMLHDASVITSAAAFATEQSSVAAGDAAAPTGDDEDDEDCEATANVTTHSASAAQPTAASRESSAAATAPEDAPATRKRARGEAKPPPPKPGRRSKKSDDVSSSTSSDEDSDSSEESESETQPPTRTKSRLPPSKKAPAKRKT